MIVATLLKYPLQEQCAWEKLTRTRVNAEIEQLREWRIYFVRLLHCESLNHVRLHRSFNNLHMFMNISVIRN